MAVVSARGMQIAKPWRAVVGARPARRSTQSIIEQQRTSKVADGGVSNALMNAHPRLSSSIRLSFSI